VTQWLKPQNTYNAYHMSPFSNRNLRDGESWYFNGIYINEIVGVILFE